MGVKKWKTEKRETVANFWEITAIMAYFDKTETGEADKDPVMAIRDRALYGLMLFTGCRPDEARCATLNAIMPYGSMGHWNKGKTMSNELDYSDAKIDAILGHEKTTSLGHYLHVSFDAMTEPIQHYDMRTGCADSRPSQLNLWARTRNPCACPREATPIPATPSPSLPVSAPLMIMPTVVSPMMPAAMPIIHRSHCVEREEWPG